MSELLNTLKKRRSVRKFQDRPISDEDLEKILEAVQWSPSWANTQCWEIISVKDPVLREKLQQTLSPRNPATKAVITAPELLVLCGIKKSSGFYGGTASTILGDWMLYDLGIATQSIGLVAEDLGLAMVVVGFFDQNRAAEILNVPDNVQVVSMMPMGYPDQSPKAPERKAIASFFHRDTYGKP
ncbi:nitroreductase family protein [Desulfococcaceae bacterium OttesenSCG-928-F15]|nr:nitroreductase family protein [Desulfococcaceae bacterium OttesenSCG-928-F15]